MLIHTPQMLANLIRDQRKCIKLTQSQATSKVGLKQTTLSRLENNPDRSQLATLFSVLSALDLEIHIIPKSQSKKTSLWKEEW